QSAPERLMRLPLFRSEFLSLAKFGDGIVEQSLGLKGLTQVGMGYGQTRPKLNENSEMRERRIDFALLKKHLAEHVLRVGAARVVRNRLFEGQSRCRQVSLLHGRESGAIILRGRSRGLSLSKTFA